MDAAARSVFARLVARSHHTLPTRHAGEAWTDLQIVEEQPRGKVTLYPTSRADALRHRPLASIMMVVILVV
jgi:hypothetical protein